MLIQLTIWAIAVTLIIFLFYGSAWSSLFSNF